MESAFTKTVTSDGRAPSKAAAMSYARPPPPLPLDRFGEDIPPPSPPATSGPVPHAASPRARLHHQLPPGLRARQSAVHAVQMTLLSTEVNRMLTHKMLTKSFAREKEATLRARDSTGQLVDRGATASEEIAALRNLVEVQSGMLRQRDASISRLEHANAVLATEVGVVEAEVAEHVASILRLEGSIAALKEHAAQRRVKAGRALNTAVREAADAATIAAAARHASALAEAQSVAEALTARMAASHDAALGAMRERAEVAEKALAEERGRELQLVPLRFVGVAPQDAEDGEEEMGGGAAQQQDEQAQQPRGRCVATPDGAAAPRRAATAARIRTWRARRRPEPSGGWSRATQSQTPRAGHLKHQG